MAVLVTGGAGYIGSHTSVELLNAGYEIIVVDNLSNSKKETLNRITEMTGKSFIFYEVDLLNIENLRTVFEQNKVDSVIHFAGFKSVSESTYNPLIYYENNITGTLNLLDCMKEFGVYEIVFSSSATVYGINEETPLKEDSTLNVTNPYGRTKLFIEEILTDIYKSNSKWSIAVLRYFNPVGAHSSGLIGEDPNGLPNNLMPIITQVAIGKIEKVLIFGNDYNTKDGTGVRDYIHVVDLAQAHIAALKKVKGDTNIHFYNIGSGKGYSVMEVISTFEKVNNVMIPYEVVKRRPGDVAISFADINKAKNELNWKPTKTLSVMCFDAWNWQRNNPNGYKS